MILSQRCLLEKDARQSSKKKEVKIDDDIEIIAEKSGNKFGVDDDDQDQDHKHKQEIPIREHVVKDVEDYEDDYETDGSKKGERICLGI
jgi:hypothetical protein